MGSEWKASYLPQCHGHHRSDNKCPLGWALRGGEGAGPQGTYPTVTCSPMWTLASPPGTLGEGSEHLRSQGSTGWEGIAHRGMATRDPPAGPCAAIQAAVHPLGLLCSFCSGGSGSESGAPGQRQPVRHQQAREKAPFQNQQQSGYPRDQEHAQAKPHRQQWALAGSLTSPSGSKTKQQVCSHPFCGRVLPLAQHEAPVPPPASTLPQLLLGAAWPQPRVTLREPSRQGTHRRCSALPRLPWPPSEKPTALLAPTPCP